MTTQIRVLPEDEHNAQLVRHVHPADWRNPTPADRYNLVVIGAGTAGLISALVASSLGAKTALIERHLMGGDCLNVGCVPSKALIRAAHMAHAARSSREIGLGIPDAKLPDFARAMERLRRVRAQISHEDSAERYSQEFGIDVFFGTARFTAPGRIDVDGVELRFAKAVIATGGRAIAPPIPGLRETGSLDNETVFTLTQRPERLVVIGAGPIGCELAQSFRRLGSEVTLLEQASQVLIREDPDAAAIVAGALVRDGVELVLDCTIEKVERRGSEKLLHVSTPAHGARAIACDEILIGAGRAPNVSDLGLERVNVAFDERTGVKVDDHLCTSNPSIYAVGDVCMQWKFTHAADAAAKLVVQNALFSFGLPFLKGRLSKLVMPWCTYTDPEVAHVGMYPRDAEQAGIEIDTYRVDMSANNRAVTDGQEEGFVKVHVKRGTDRIVGGTIVAAHAGDLISQLTLAMQKGIGLGAFSSVIYPYPTQAEAIKRAAGQYTRTRLTPSRKQLLTRILRMQR